MALVTMPDGTVVDMPDSLTPELAARLRSLNDAGSSVTPPQQSTQDNKLQLYNKLQLSPKEMGGMGVGITKAAYDTGSYISDLATKFGVSPEISGGLGAAANVGIESIPMIAGGEISKLASPAFRTTAEKLMQSALKPTLRELKSGQAATAVNTMLDSGINMSKGGINALKNRIDAIDEKITSAISSSTDTVTVSDILKPLKDKLEQVKMQVTPDADVSAVKSAWDEFLNHPLLSKATPAQKIDSLILNSKGSPATSTIIPEIPSSDVPVQLAQQLKTGTYRELSKKYGEVGATSTEAQKAIARGLKDAIAEKVVGISDLNSAQSKLLDTLSIAEKRVLLEGNKNPIGLSALATTPERMALYVADKSSLFKSLLARLINAGREQVPATVGRLGVAGYEAASQPNMLTGQQP